MKRGFTLIEILIVVIILAVIAGISIPNFAKSLITIELSQTAQDLLMTMRFAQSRSVLQGGVYQLVFEDGFKSYHLEQAKTDTSETEEEIIFIPMNNRWGKKHLVPSSVSVTLDRSTVRFYSDGTIEPIRIEVSNNKSKFFLSTMEQRGHVFIWEQT